MNHNSLHLQSLRSCWFLIDTEMGSWLFLLQLGLKDSHITLWVSSVSTAKSMQYKLKNQVKENIVSLVFSL